MGVRVAVGGEAPVEVTVPGSERTEVQRFWDRLAPRFDGGSEADQAIARALAKARPYLSAADTVLDLGCATGHASLRLADDVARVVGIDISEKMVAIATQRAARLEVENVVFVRASVFDDPPEPGPFEAVLAFNILHLLHDRQEALARIADMLRPGGTLLAASPCLGEGATLADRGLRTGLRLLSRAGILPHVGIFTVLALQEGIRAAGLVPVEVADLEARSAVHFVAARKPVVSLAGPAA